MNPVVVPTPAVSLMTGDQQFYLAMAALVLNTLVLVLTYLKSSDTHRLVNSELTEWKNALKAIAAQGVSDARLQGLREGREIQHQGPAGPRGEVGPTGPKGSP